MKMIDYMVIQKKKPKFLNRENLSPNVFEDCASATFQDGIEDYMQLHFVGYELIPVITEENYDYVRDMCTAVYNVNYYKYNKLYDTLTAEYELLKNRNEDYSGTITHSGKDIDQKENGEQKVTNDLGSRVDNYNENPRTDTDTNSVAPFENDTFHAKEKLNKEYGNRSGKNTRDSTKDTSTRQAYTDKDTFTHGHVIKDEHTISGLVGNYTPQDLIEKERRIALFNLYEVICKDIISKICLLYTGVMLEGREWDKRAIETLQQFFG